MLCLQSMGGEIYPFLKNGGIVMAALESFRHKDHSSLPSGESGLQKRYFVSKTQPLLDLDGEKKSIRGRLVSSLPTLFPKEPLEVRSASVSFDLVPVIIKEEGKDFTFIEEMLVKERCSEEIVVAILHQRGDEPSEIYEKILAKFLLEKELYFLMSNYYKCATSQSIFIEMTLERANCREILKQVIHQECSQITVANDFRGNTFASKLCSAFFEQELGEQLLEIREKMQKESKSLGSTLEKEGREALFKKGRFQSLMRDTLNSVYALKMTDSVADVLVDEYQLLIKKFPRDIVEQLIGSKVVLRVVNPYLSDPKSYSNKKQLDIAVEISRIIQKVANSSLYGPQDTGSVLNSIISEYLSKHRNYVRKYLISLNS